MSPASPFAETPQDRGPTDRPRRARAAALRSPPGAAAPRSQPRKTKAGRQQPCWEPWPAGRAARRRLHGPEANYRWLINARYELPRVVVVRYRRGAIKNSARPPAPGLRRDRRSWPDVNCCLPTIVTAAVYNSGPLFFPCPALGVPCRFVFSSLPRHPSFSPAFLSPRRSPRPVRSASRTLASLPQYCVARFIGGPGGKKGSERTGAAVNPV